MIRSHEKHWAVTMRSMVSWYENMHLPVWTTPNSNTEPT